MTDEQFERYLSTLEKRLDDHDLLIRIDANLVAFNKAFLSHCEADAKEFAILEKSVQAVHRRVDNFTKIVNMGSGIIAFLGVVSMVSGILFTLHKTGLW